MKRTQKKILGFLGLFVVGVTTIFAAMLPGPEASAISTVTDTITVTVVGTSPLVNITNGGEFEAITSEADQTLRYHYQNVNKIKVIVDRTDKDDVEHKGQTVYEYDTGTEVGDGEYLLNLNSPELGYGKYVVTVQGYKEGEGIFSESSVEFEFLPAIVDLNKGEGSEDPVATLNYDKDNNDIDHFGIEILDEDGNKVGPSSPVIVTPPDDKVTIPISECDLPEGEYTIATTAYDEDGNELYTSYTVVYVYNPAPEPAPKVQIVEPTNGTITSDAEQNITIDHEDVTKLTITIKRTDKDGVEHTKIVEVDTALEPDTTSLPYNLNDQTDPDLGYGIYTVTVVGTNAGEVVSEQSISFEFLPVIVDTTRDPETGDADVTLDYDEDNNDIDHFVIIIKDSDGNPIDGIPPIIVTPPDTKVTIPFSEYGLPEGKYIIETTAYDADGNALYTPYNAAFKYSLEPEPEPEHEDIPVPNTGGFLKNLNISRTDYLITGLIIFFTFGIGSIVFVMKGKKADGRNRKR